MTFSYLKPIAILSALFGLLLITSCGSSLTYERIQIEEKCDWKVGTQFLD